MSAKTTGYTHQWNKPKYKEYSKFFMSSTHNDIDRKKASDIGYRSFFVTAKPAKGESFNVPSNAVNCPASKESTKNLSCIACGLCNGAKSGIKKDIYIMKH